LRLRSDPAPIDPEITDSSRIHGTTVPIDLVYDRC